ncbi:MAG: TRAP transporter large permease subunit, partial [Oscillospiraceae bacterium]|nr:TRAP transporter large permease subunit [Oscillospiraceae bacterium]
MCVRFPGCALGDPREACSRQQHCRCPGGRDSREADDADRGEDDTASRRSNSTLSLIAGASVGKLFAAGYIPGFVMAIALMVAVNIIANKRGYAPSRDTRASVKEILKQGLDSFWALFFPLGIIMGMRMGLFTPTEAGGVGILYFFIIGKFVYRGLKKEHFIPVFRETISGTCTVMLIIVAANLFGYYLTW